MAGPPTEGRTRYGLELPGRYPPTPQLHQNPLDSRPQGTMSSSEEDLPLIGDQLIGSNYYSFKKNNFNKATIAV
jgi:hypothetical protein